MIAQPQYAPDRFERSVAAIHALIADLGIGRHALFYEVGEGEAFPDGSESMSGHVIDARGRIFLFWTGWDAGRSRPVFTAWEQVELEPRMAASAEYREAVARVSGVPKV